MKHDSTQGEVEELVALYAAGALTEVESSQFEAHLAAGCEECSALLQTFDRVVAELTGAFPPVAPHPRTREALLNRIAPASKGTASPLRPHVEQARRLGEDAGLVIQRGAEASWESTAVPGVSVRVLFVDPEKNQLTALVRMAPGTSYPPHRHSGPEECLVLEGDLQVGVDVLRQGDYQRAATGTSHGEQSTEQGCLLLVTSSLTDVFE
jgi:putative transcriptional regulator